MGMMEEFEEWDRFNRAENLHSSKPACYFCGRPCSGDTTTELDSIEVHDEFSAWLAEELAGNAVEMVSVCDDAVNCEKVCRVHEEMNRRYGHYE